MGGRTSRGGKKSGATARAGGGSGGGSTLSGAPLSKSDQEQLKLTKSLFTANIKEQPDSETALQVSRDATAVVNDLRKSGYTVYSSGMAGFSRTSPTDFKSHLFAGVGFGSGESTSALANAARILRDNGFRAKVVDNSNYRGVIVSYK